tara:strand:+ start:212 stop:694 length:483 start_codon:yes stop_codon:yes gene_type:complete
MAKQFKGFFVVIVKDQGNEKSVDLRSTKAACQLFQCMCMIYLSAFGYFVLKDEPYMPWGLGGRGDFSKSLANHPYPKHSPYLKEYYMCGISYHVGKLIIHFVNKRENDFIEMGLHHTVTLYLLVGSYLYNVWEVGAVICFLHDLTDAIGSSCKVSSQTNF